LSTSFIFQENANTFYCQSPAKTILAGTFLKSVEWPLSGKLWDLSDRPNVLYFQCASTVKIWVTILEQISTAPDFGQALKLLTDI